MPRRTLSVPQSQQEPGGKCFTFVNVSNLVESGQRATQKVIRRHVMARVGNSRRKCPPSWTFILNPRRSHHDRMCYSSRSSNEQKPELQHQLELPRCMQAPRSLHPYGLFPVETDLRARQLIHFSMLVGDVPAFPFGSQFTSAHGGRVPLPAFPTSVVRNGGRRLHCVLPFLSKCCLVLPPNHAKERYRV